MRDLIGYVRHTRLELSLLPAKEDAFVRIQVRDPATGLFDERVLTEEDLLRTDGRPLTGLETGLTQMAADIAERKNKLYQSRKNVRKDSEKRREMEMFWQDNPSPLTEGVDI